MIMWYTCQGFDGVICCNIDKLIMFIELIIETKSISKM